MGGEAKDSAAPETPEPRYYIRAILLTFAAVAIGFATFVFKIATEADASPWADTAFYVALVVFLLVTPALHVASIVNSVLGLRRGHGRLEGFAALVVNLVFVFFGFFLGAAALIGASA